MKKFSQINNMTMVIAIEGHIVKRKMSDSCHHASFALSKSPIQLDHCLYQHQSLIHRHLGSVDAQLQSNKAKNLAIASEKINAVIIKPGETFSLWKLVGRYTKRKGYVVGMTISGNKPSAGVGGGLCQLTNLIHWLVLHSPLDIVEHHHDQFDLFPDYHRQVPFGVGTSIHYNYLDYRFVNNTDQQFQLFVWTDEKYLFGKLMCEHPLPTKIHIENSDEYFSKEGKNLYRYGKIYRRIIDKRTGITIQKTLIKDNRATVLYDHALIPDDKIRNTLEFESFISPSL